MTGRAAVQALDLAESLHSRRPTLAEVRLIADMLHTLRNQQQARGGSSNGGGSGIAGGCQHDRRTDKGSDDAGGEDDDKPKKVKKKKKDTMDTKEKKDKKADKKDKKAEKKKKKDKKRKSGKERDGDGEGKGATTTTTEDNGGGSESGIGSGITNGAGTMAVLGGRLEYTEETKGENEATLTLATADTLKLKELVHAYLKQALSTAPSPGRSPRDKVSGFTVPAGRLSSLRHASGAAFSLIASPTCLYRCVTHHTEPECHAMELRDPCQD
jgi:hypothetical protein